MTTIRKISGRGDAKRRILNCARSLFYLEGIRAVGIDRIIAEAGVAKATFYQNFASKEDLVTAYLVERDRQSISALREAVENSAGGVVGAVDGCFEYLAARTAATDFRGCAIVLAYADQRNSETAKTLALRHKRAVRDVFAQALEAGGIQNETIADQLLLLYEGVLATAALGTIDRAAEVARAAATDLVQVAKRI